MFRKEDTIEYTVVCESEQIEEAVRRQYYMLSKLDDILPKLVQVFFKK